MPDRSLINEFCEKERNSVIQKFAEITKFRNLVFFGFFRFLFYSDFLGEKMIYEIDEFLKKIEKSEKQKIDEKKKFFEKLGIDFVF